MKTKTGKSHFKCEFRTHDSTGEVRYEDLNHKFTAFNAEDYVNRVKNRYASHGMKAEFTNVVNLDDIIEEV